MGLVSIAAGIFLGVFCSQFITAMLLTSYGKQYEITWTLFPDTVLLTVAFFVPQLSYSGTFQHPGYPKDEDYRHANRRPGERAGAPQEPLDLDADVSL